MLKPLAIPLLVLLGLAALSYWGIQQQATPQKPLIITCVNPVAGCQFSHPGSAPQVKFSTVPETLKPFDITISNTTSAQAFVSFQMDGMNMGFTRYTMQKVAPLTWRARVTLPVCTSRRTDWIAEFTLNGRLYQVKFQTAG